MKTDSLRNPTTTLNIRSVDVEVARRMKAGAARMGLTLAKFLGPLLDGWRFDARKARFEVPELNHGKGGYWTPRPETAAQHRRRIARKAASRLTATERHQSTR